MQSALPLFLPERVSGYTPTQVMGTQDSSYIDQTFNLVPPVRMEMIESPAFGPARSWTALHWGRSVETTNITDQVKMDVIGIRADGSTKPAGNSDTYRGYHTGLH